MTLSQQVVSILRSRGYEIRPDEAQAVIDATPPECSHDPWLIAGIVTLRNALENHRKHVQAMGGTRKWDAV